MFNLNQTIKHWRKALDAEPNLRSSDLDELEDHLREEITALMTDSLSEEEAFIIASRRLGKPEDLSGEFAIADPERRRSFRLSWMITGALALALVWLASIVLSNLGAGALSRFPGEGVFTHGIFSLAWVSGLIRLGALVFGGLLIWRLLATDRTSRRLSRMGGWTVFSFSFLLAFLALLTLVVSRRFMVMGFSQIGFMNYSVPYAHINMIVLYLLPVFLLLGLWRLVKSQSKS